MRLKAILGILSILLSGCGGYLTPSQVEGLYLFSSGNVSERIRINRDMTYVQTLSVGQEAYASEGKCSLNEGSEIVFQSLYVRYKVIGEVIDPPEKDKWVSVTWYPEGIMRFTLLNKRTSRFESDDQYFLTRAKESPQK